MQFDYCNKINKGTNKYLFNWGSVWNLFFSILSVKVSQYRLRSVFVPAISRIQHNPVVIYKEMWKLARLFYSTFQTDLITLKNVRVAERADLYGYGVIFHLLQHSFYFPNFNPSFPPSFPITHSFPPNILILPPPTPFPPNLKLSYSAQGTTDLLKGI